MFVLNVVALLDNANKTNVVLQIARINGFVLYNVPVDTINSIIFTIVYTGYNNMFHLKLYVVNYLLSIGI